MKLVKQERLQFPSGGTIQRYEIDLCELGPDRFVVNFRYSRGGNLFNEGTKTPNPVTESEAQRIFTGLIASQREKGYRSLEAPAESSPEGSSNSGTIPSSESLESSKIETAVLGRIRSGSSTKSGWKLSRAVWRCGELNLHQSERYLLALLGTDDWMLDYCVAWALGQCGSVASAEELRSLESDEKAPGTVRRMAGFALREVVDEEQRRQLIDECLGKLPNKLSELARSGSAVEFEGAFREALDQAQPDLSHVLEMVYFIDNEVVRPALLNALRTLKFEPNEFQRIRHIFKVAEMRRDPEVFGIMAFRFETTFGNFRSGPQWHYRRFPKPSVGPKPDKAYSSQTRDYFRRRIWRVLRRFGEMGSPEYCRLAAGVLRQFDDSTGGQPQQVRRYQWDPRSRRSSVSVIHYDRFSRYVAFNRILFGNSPRYAPDNSKMRFRCVEPYQPGAAEPPDREESFPELWNNAPEIVVNLLIESRCSLVHSFGVKVLQANPEFPREMPLPMLISLLEVPYEITLQFSFQVARERFDPQTPDGDLLLALAGCEYGPAQEQARQWIRECRDAFASNAAFWAGLIISRQEATRRFARDILRDYRLATETEKTVVAKTLAELRELSNGTIAKDAGETLLIVFSELLKTIGEDVIRDLVHHPLAEVQRFAGELLARHGTLATHPPVDLLNALLSSEHESVRSVGVRVVTYLPEGVLLESHDLLLALSRHEREDIRALIRPRVKELALTHPDFGREIARRLIDALLQAGAPEGVPTHTARLLKEDFREFLFDVSADTVWTLLESRSPPAQDVGGMLLATNVEPASLSVEAIVKLCHHKMASVRESARSMCVLQLNRLKNEPEDAVLMVDSPWEDTRQFAFTFFREHFSEEGALSAAALIALCDSIRPDVQQFGRSMVTRLFESDDAHVYLQNLSEHPAVTMQLFVSNFLDQHVDGSAERLVDLSPYFISVLSRVNQGRAAKQRTLALLERESVKSEEAARIVADVLSRLSATTSVQYKGKIVEILAAIQERYPHVGMPLETVPLEIRDGV
ncbi:MAG: hypothetical protein KDA80_04195 [Planctomycetaceae bacterium]|nr:hypothetical protein [Planctomycetaceae bacterium]